MPGSSAAACDRPMVRPPAGADVVQVTLPRSEPIGDEQDRRPDDQETGNRQPRHVLVTVERGFDGVLECEADERRRDGGQDEQPPESPLAVVADAALEERPPQGAEQPQPVTADVVEQREQGPEVQEHVERQAADEPVLRPAEDPRRQLEVRRRADRDELGQPLDQTDDDGLEDQVHRPAPQLADEQRGEDQGDGREQLDEDVE